MDLAIATLNNPERGFLDESLASLLASGPWCDRVHLFVGSPDTSHVDGWAERSRFVVHRFPARTWDVIRDQPLFQRYNANYQRCLEHFASRGQGVVVAEDDVLYDPNFALKFAGLRAEAEAFRPEAIVALYSAWDYVKDHAHRRCTPLLAVAVPDSFYGTQGMYYPAGTVAEVAERVRTHASGGRTPVDVALAEWTKPTERLLISTVSLIQHIGRRSTGLGGWHDSPTFGQVWPNEPTAGAEPGR